MLITKTHYDIPTSLDPNGRPIRIFVLAPTIPGYPNAKFPGEVHPELADNGIPTDLMILCIARCRLLQVMPWLARLSGSTYC